MLRFSKMGMGLVLPVDGRLRVDSPYSALQATDCPHGTSSRKGGSIKEGGILGYQ
jgi:hypothetical protein